MAKTVKSRKRKIGRFNYRAKPKLTKAKSYIKDKIFKSEKTEANTHVWDKKKSGIFNCEKLGIVYNLNKAMKPVTFKDESSEEIKKNTKPKQETAFVKKLLADSEKQKAKNSLRMPPRTVEFVTHLLDTYGENFKAMALDGRNYDQETWKQLRSKINKFKSCTDQYAQYLKKRNLLNVSLKSSK